MSQSADAVIRSRINSTLKARAERTFSKMGLSLSEGIRLFLVRTVADQALPFDVRVPNAVTRAAMIEADALTARFASADALFEDIENARLRKTRKPAAKKR